MIDNRQRLEFKRQRLVDKLRRRQTPVRFVGVRVKVDQMARALREMEM